MNLSYLVYRVFETKWKRKIFDEATEELRKIPKDRDTLIQFLVAQKHLDQSTELMDLII